MEPRGVTRLVEGLTTALLRWEGAPGHASAVVGFVHELPSGAVNVGGKPAELLIYRVLLTVPQGTPGIHGPLNEQRRNEPRAQGTCLRLSQ